MCIHDFVWVCMSRCVRASEQNSACDCVPPCMCVSVGV